MSRTAAVLLTTVLLVAGVPGAAAVSSLPSPGVAAQAETTTTPSQNQTAPIPPGARLSGLVAVQGAEVENEVERRAFGVRLAGATSNASRAAVVAEQVDDLHQRTAEIKAQRQAVLEARQNGSISQARFEAEMAALAVQNGAVNARLNETEAVSTGIPEAVLAEKGVNAAAINAVRNEAREGAGPDAADIARSIAGGAVGGGLSTATNATARGPPDDPTDRRPEQAGGAADETGTTTTDALETEERTEPLTGPQTVTTPDRPTPKRPTVDRTPAGQGNGPDDGRGPFDGFPLGWLP